MPPIIDTLHDLRARAAALLNGVLQAGATDDANPYRGGGSVSSFEALDASTICRHLPHRGKNRGTRRW